MSLIPLATTCLWFLLVPSFTSAKDSNVNCLRSIHDQVQDPNRYLSDWFFTNKTERYICTFNGVNCWQGHDNKISSIKLSGFGLRGEFPHGIKECSDLTSLDLSRNNFSGSLPSDISSLIPFVTSLDLSNNSFSGEIPVSLSYVTFMNTLMLQQNQFTGQLPPQLVLLGRLNNLSVADNLLTGPVPKFDLSLNIGVDSFANNLDLCGWPMDACVDPEEDMILFVKIGAAIGATIFAPLGAYFGWFLFNDRNKIRRSWIYKIGD